MSRSEHWAISVPKADLLCPICRDIIRDVYCTPCGHSFCYACIMRNLEHRQLCPCCSQFVTKDKLYPNTLLAKLIHNAEAADQVQSSSVLEQLKYSIISSQQRLSREDIQELETVLQKTKSMMEFEDLEVQMQMLQRFLTHTRDQKASKLDDLSQLLDALQLDMSAVGQQQEHLQALRQQQQQQHRHANGVPGSGLHPPPGRGFTSLPGGESTSGGAAELAGMATAWGGEPGGVPPPSPGAGMPQSNGGLDAMGKKQLAFSQFNELSECYMRLRRGYNAAEKRGVSSEVSAAALMGKSAGGKQGSALDEFARTLSVCTFQNKLEVLSENRMQTGMLSAMEFNVDGTVLATAGVSKCIKIMDAEAIKAGHSDSAMAGADIVTRAKLSSLSWNRFIKHHLISSDFEGVLTLWDVNTGQIVQDYEAHEKRIWSVDFCPCDPYLAVSGSDDGKVKVWSTKQHAAAFQLDIRVNVCSVAYSKVSAYTVAVGSADHTVRVYDLRRPMSPVNTFQGHSKAISYVDFISDHQVVSASTDSTLRMWDLTTNSLVRTFTGHKNQRNFVGMSVHDDFVACGSETSEVYVYFKELSQPIVVHSFTPLMPQEFMSAVSWQPKSSTLFAVSSSGVMKALQLTGS